MIRTLLATTAIATLVATGAIAQSTTPAPMQQPPAAATDAPMVVKADGHLASNLIGESVYNGAGDDAESIGDINDLVIGPDGAIQAVVIGVGGFLGIGQKDVAIEYNLIEWAERDNDRYAVVETTADALKAQEEFDRAAYEPMPADAQVTETKPATKEQLDTARSQVEQEKAAADQQAQAPAGNMGTAPSAAPPAGTATPPAGNMAAEQPAGTAPAGNMAATPPATDGNATDNTQTSAVDPSTMTEVPMAEMRTEDLVGTTVYGAGDENIGEVGDVIMSGEKVDAIIIDVGGFLGIGEKEVAVGMDNLSFMRDGDGEFYLYTEFSQEQLEAQAEYDESGYAASRDDMRMTVPAQ